MATIFDMLADGHPLRERYLRSSYGRVEKEVRPFRLQSKREQKRLEAQRRSSLEHAAREEQQYAPEKGVFGM